MTELGNLLKILFLLFLQFFQKMSNQRQGRIFLQIYENHFKIKEDIEISRTLSYQQLFSMVYGLIKRQKFRLQLYPENPKDQKPFKIVTQKVFKELLSNYNGQKLNINTELQQKNGIERSPATIFEHKGRLKLKKQSNRHVLRQSQQQQVQRGLGINQNQNQEQRNILPFEGKQDKSNQISEQCNITIENISNKYEESLYNQSCKKPRQQFPKESNLNKRCSQCKSNCEGYYFICLVCEPCIILCDQCENKEDFIVLKSHKFRQHPFAKIKRWTQQIRSVSVATHQTTDNQRNHLKEKNVSDHNIETINQFIDTKLLQAIQKKLSEDKKQL